MVTQLWEVGDLYGSKAEQHAILTKADFMKHATPEAIDALVAGFGDGFAPFTRKPRKLVEIDLRAHDVDARIYVISDMPVGASFFTVAGQVSIVYNALAELYNNPTDENKRYFDSVFYRRLIFLQRKEGKDAKVDLTNSYLQYNKAHFTPQRTDIAKLSTFVLPEHRRNKYASRLSYAVEQAARDKEAEYLLAVCPTNSPMEVVNRTQQMSTLCTIDPFYKNSQSATLLIKSLKTP